MLNDNKNLLETLHIETERGLYGHLYSRAQTSLRILHEDLMKVQICQLNLGFLIALMDTVRHGLDECHELERAWNNCNKENGK